MKCSWEGTFLENTDNICWPNTQNYLACTGNIHKQNFLSNVLNWLHINCGRGNITSSILKNAWRDGFLFLDYLHLFNHICKTSQGIVFQRINFFHMFPLLHLMATNWDHLIQSFFLCLSYLGMDVFQQSGYNMMPISCNAS